MAFLRNSAMSRAPNFERRINIQNIVSLGFETLLRVFCYIMMARSLNPKETPKQLRGVMS